MDAQSPDDASMVTDAGNSPVDAGSCELGDDAGAACNTLENIATNVTITAASGTMATGTGGAILNGTYVLSEVRVYPGSSLPVGVLIRQTLEICNGRTQLSENIADTPSSTHKNFTLEPEGTVPNLDMTCSTRADDMGTMYSSYTATATTVTLYNADDSFQMTFTRQ